VLEDPSGNRQVQWQRWSNSGNAYDGNWSIYYSPGGRFGEGQTPGTDWDADTRPVAPDEGQEASSGNVLFQAGLVNTMSHVAADDTPSPEGEYGVFCVEFKGTNAMSGAFMLDDLRNAPVGHPHPYTIFADATSAFSYFSFFGTGSNDSPDTVVGAGTPGEGFVYNCPICYWTSYVAGSMPGAGGVGGDGKERALPMVVISAGVKEYRGVSRWLRLPSVTRDYPNTGTSQQYLFAQSVLIVDLLDGVTTPLPI